MWSNCGPWNDLVSILRKDLPSTMLRSEHRQLPRKTAAPDDGTTVSVTFLEAQEYLRKLKAQEGWKLA